MAEPVIINRLAAVCTLGSSRPKTSAALILQVHPLHYGASPYSRPFSSYTGQRAYLIGTPLPPQFGSLLGKTSCHCQVPQFI